MLTKSGLNVVCLTLLPFLLILSWYYLYAGFFLNSLGALLGVLVCVRLRLWMGYRGTRGWLFYVHVACSLTLATLLIVLAFFDVTYTVAYFAYAAFISMTLTGIALIQRSWKRVA